MMPYPFSKGVFIYAEPIRVERDAGDEEMEKVRVDLEESLTRITESADSFFS